MERLFPWSADRTNADSNSDSDDNEWTKLYPTVTCSGDGNGKCIYVALCTNSIILLVPKVSLCGALITSARNSFHHHYYYYHPSRAHTISRFQSHTILRT